MTTPNLQLPEVPQAIQDAADELNAGNLRLDAIVQLAVIDKDLTEPPDGAVQGDRYIVADPGSTDWPRVRAVAMLGPDGWLFLQPRPGWIARVLDEARWYIYSGTEWEIEAEGGGDSGSSGGGGDASPLTTRGDLYTHDGYDGAREPIGEQGAFLQVDLAQANALKWTQATIAPASGARVYRTTSQSIADTTLTALQWESEDFDTHAYWTSGSNTRLTIPSAGKYSVGASIRWDSNTTNTREVYVVKNGVTGTRLAGSRDSAAIANRTQLVSTLLDLAAADYLEVYVQQDSGGARDVLGTEQITSAWVTRIGPTQIPTHPRGATWDRRGAAIATPATDVAIRIPKASTIKKVTVLAGPLPGACVIDIWKDSYANYPPTVADTICASAKPTIAAGLKYEDATLTGWTVAIAAGDVLIFHLDSCATFRSVTILLDLEETGA